MYVVGSDAGPGGSVLYRVDTFTSSPQRVTLADPGLLLADIAVTPSGSGYVIAYPSGPLGPYELRRIDLVSGATTFVMSIPTSQDSLEALNDDVLYCWGFLDPMLYRIDLRTLTVTPVVNMGRFGSDLALAPNGFDLYGSSLDRQLLRVNLVTLAVTNIGALDGGPGLRFPGIDFGPQGELYGVSGIDLSASAAVYRIDTQTAATTLVGDISGLGCFGISIRGSVVAVPTLSPRALAVMVALLSTVAVVALRWRG